MIYRRNAFKPRKYTNFNSSQATYNDSITEYPKDNSVENTSDIPLPNETEIPEPPDMSEVRGKTNLFHFIKTKIHFEEIILIGLIILLIDEGITCLEDELLLVVLIFLLLT